MMTFWIIVLRAIGVVLFVLGVLIGTYFNILNKVWINQAAWVYADWLPVIEKLGMSAFCFGMAAGLSAIKRIDGRLIQVMTSRRRRSAGQQEQAGFYNPPPAMPYATAPQTQRLQNLAPVAPDWKDVKPGIHAAGAERHAARGRRLISYESLPDPVPSPIVRRTPHPVRITPGTEAQYMDEPPIIPHDTQPIARMKAPYDHPGQMLMDKDLLRRGRDAQIRRQQAEQSRRRRDKA